MNKPLSGKTAIITGASSGIGRATALTLVRAGAAVAIQARRKDRLDDLASEILSQGGKALAVPGDAGIQADIDLLLADSTVQANPPSAPLPRRCAVKSVHTGCAFPRSCPVS
jgi:NADP-dependent 3-hydroxy acid dehydrogenase YdfG